MYSTQKWWGATRSRTPIEYRTGQDSITASRAPAAVMQYTFMIFHTFYFVFFSFSFFYIFTLLQFAPIFIMILTNCVYNYIYRCSWYIYIYLARFIKKRKTFGYFCPFTTGWFELFFIYILKYLNSNIKKKICFWFPCR